MTVLHMLWDFYLLTCTYTSKLKLWTRKKIIIGTRFYCTVAFIVARATSVVSLIVFIHTVLLVIYSVLLSLCGILKASFCKDETNDTNIYRYRNVRTQIYVCLSSTWSNFFLDSFFNPQLTVVLSVYVPIHLPKMV